MKVKVEEQRKGNIKKGKLQKIEKEVEDEDVEDRVNIKEINLSI
tara:strand:- start:345 stop:476 length:132 start_codon:yes stop_codon:yes gene_type:complete